MIWVTVMISQSRCSTLPSLLLLGLIAVSVFSGASLAAERVYKWTDENGVVHFSATPPPDQTTEQINIQSAPPPQAAAETSEDAPSGELFADAEQPDNSEIEERNRVVQCQKGRNMIEQIEPRPRVFRVEADGSRTYLEDDERLKLLKEAKDLVAEHCNS
ncbi:MAG: DUF4124 domain-containing protein [Lysobacterales bacterium]